MIDNWYKIAKENNHKYSWVFVELPKDISKQIIEFGEQIESEDLYREEADNGLELSPHITVKYGLITDDNKDIKECLEKPVGGNVYIGESSIFECEKYDVVKMSVESDTLFDIHEQLNRLPHNDKFIEYKPHVTIAYVKKGKGKKYDKKFKLDCTFRVDKIYFGNNSKDFTFKLSNNWYYIYKNALLK